MQKSTKLANAVWSISVALSLSQNIGTTTISLSRMVAQTFSNRMQSKVWSSRVCAFAIFVQFVFPVCFVCAFLLDDPLFSLDLGEHSLFVVWGNRKLHSEFYTTYNSILLSLFSFCFIAYCVVLIKQAITCKKRARQSVSINFDLTVHAVRSDPESEDSSSVVPHRSNVAPFFTHRETHLTVISLVSIGIYFHQWTVDKDPPSAPSVWPTEAVVAMSMQSLLLIYWILPYFRRHLLSPCAAQKVRDIVLFWHRIMSAIVARSKKREDENNVRA
ncbi:hypothetical protein AB6A40_000183 [Gnathostoma spinigerum]|uniref:G protein-coupled receptor n=1 Tax=Gnathostoma spinigerum TaxID=75299 RepID=A0ABD6E7X3_9BILA